MDTNFNRREKAVGSFLIIIAIASLTTLLVIGRGKDWFKSYITYYTIFNESYNLQEEAPVKMYNAEVGKVKSIEIYEDKVKVELRVLEEYASRIKTDAIAVVESTGISGIVAGSHYVSIKPGSADASPLPREGQMASDKKETLTDILNEFGVQETARKITAAIKDIVEIIKRLKDPQGPLFSTIDNLYKTTYHVEGLTRDLQAGKGTAGGLLKSTELLDMIQMEMARLDVILENVGDATERAPGAMDQVQESLERVKRILDEVIESASSISVVLKEVEKGSGEIPQLTQTAKRSIAEMRSTLENADKILQSLQNNFLIRPNLPPQPKGEAVDAGLR